MYTAIPYKAYFAVSSAVTDTTTKREGRTRTQNLSKRIINRWMRVTCEKEGHYISTTTETIWDEDDRGNYFIVENMNGKMLNAIMASGQRGLHDAKGKPLWKSLKAYREKYGFSSPRILSESMLCEWMISTFEKTGKYITGNTPFIWTRTGTGFSIVPCMNGNKLNTIIAKGLCGLRDKQNVPLWKGLAEVKERHGFIAEIPSRSAQKQALLTLSLAP